MAARRVQDHDGIDRIRIILVRQTIKMIGNSMSKTVNYKVDLNNSPVLPDEQKKAGGFGQASRQ